MRQATAIGDASRHLSKPLCNPTLGFLAATLLAGVACNTGSGVRVESVIVRVDTESSFLSSGERSGWHLAPTAATGKDGTLYVVWTGSVEDRTDVLLAHSEDSGRSFTDARVVNDVAGVAATGSSQVRPIVATGPQGEVIVVWADKRRKLGMRGGVDIYSAISTDDGMTFGPSVRVDGGTGMASQPFLDAEVDQNGVIYVVWLGSQRTSDSDRWHLDVYFAKSTDGGKTFQANVNITAAQGHGVCECCRPDIWVGEGGEIYISYRNSKENIRDIYLSRSDDGGQSFLPPERVGYNNWELRGCPSDGPTIVGTKGGPLVVWMDGKSGTGKIYRSRWNAERRSFDKEAELFPSGDGTNRRHPTLVQSAGAEDSTERDLYLAWEESLDGNKDIALAQSSDGGRTFQPVEWHSEIESGSGRSPWLVSGPRDTYLVWTEEADRNRHIYIVRLFLN